MMERVRGLVFRLLQKAEYFAVRKLPAFNFYCSCILYLLFIYILIKRKFTVVRMFNRRSIYLKFLSVQYIFVEYLHNVVQQISRTYLSRMN